ncbi:MAG: protein-disulfide reductase DsbD family protein, partial [Rhodobacteraceae bacterium]|nr:protein-disulfide reductase DsbD family protein [Paracoccaceae bacterium]
MTYRLIPLLLSAVLALAAPLAQAQPVPDNLLKAEILPGWRTESGSQMAALRLTMAPGWKTYWRAPGDAGIPPRFDWTGSANLK